MAYHPINVAFGGGARKGNQPSFGPPFVVQVIDSNSNINSLPQSPNWSGSQGSGFNAAQARPTLPPSLPTDNNQVPPFQPPETNQISTTAINPTFTAISSPVFPIITASSTPTSSHIPSNNSTGMNNYTIPLIITSSLSFILLICILLCFCRFRRKRKEMKDVEQLRDFYNSHVLGTPDYEDNDTNGQSMTLEDKQRIMEFNRVYGSPVLDYQPKHRPYSQYSYSNNDQSIKMANLNVPYSDGSQDEKNQEFGNEPYPEDNEIDSIDLESEEEFNQNNGDNNNHESSRPYSYQFPDQLQNRPKSLGWDSTDDQNSIMSPNSINQPQDSNTIPPSINSNPPMNSNPPIPPPSSTKPTKRIAQIRSLFSEEELIALRRNTIQNERVLAIPMARIGSRTASGNRSVSFSPSTFFEEQKEESDIGMEESIEGSVEEKVQGPTNYYLSRDKT